MMSSNSTTTTAIKLQKRPGAGTKGADLERLRQILLGKDYEELLALKKQLNSPQQHSAKVAAIVSEALAIRSQQDNTLSEILSPTVEGALIESVERDPKRLANALYPVMGPAIRKSINEVLTQTVDTFNQLLEQSLSPRSFLWRFDAWRSGKSYAEVMLLNTLEYQVEQVFLIHTDTGLLLRHVVSPQAISKDPDMVSGMLTAIQDFIADSFAVNDSDTLKHMRLGELTVQVEQGPYAVIAAVVRGSAPAALPALLQQTAEDIHQQMGHTLQTYAGDSEPFARIHPLLEKCLLSQAQEKQQKRPWLTYILVSVCLLGVPYWGYQAYQSDLITQQVQKQQQAWQQLLTVFAAEPGVVVIDARFDGEKRMIKGLLDPLAQSPENLLKAFIADSAIDPVREREMTTTLDFQPYISAEPAIAQKRAYKILRPPVSVQLAVENSVLKVSGSAAENWYERLLFDWPVIAGVTKLDISGFTVNDR